MLNYFIIKIAICQFLLINLLKLFENLLNINNNIQKNVDFLCKIYYNNIPFQQVWKILIYFISNCLGGCHETI